MLTKQFSLLLLALVVGLVPVIGQDEEDKKDKDSKEKKEKQYEDVITDKAETDEGLITVHKVGGEYYFEFPKDLLDQEMLIVTRIAGHVKGINFGGAGMKSRPQQVIRFQEKDGKVMMRSVSYSNVADPNDPVYRSVKNNNFEPVVHMFDVEVENPDSTALIFEVSELFTTDVPMIGAFSESSKKRLKIKGLDKKRCFVEHMHAYPENLEVRHVLTYKSEEPPENESTETLSLEMNQSIIRLPETPMVPRHYDSRVGYFSIRQTDYSSDAQKADEKRYITRWRLEPKDPAAYARGELVEPVKPIVYYIDPATPEQWRSYIKQGVEDWQSAFEKAGFKNAILAKDPPSPEEDPEWSPEDVRFSVIRYITTDIQNAQGPHVHDPRTGEILESDILWYHNVMNLLRNWFFVQTAAVNAEAQRPKFDEEVMGELIRFVSAHEVGHTLGLPHNMGASEAYPVDSLRSSGFVQRMGVAPSIMDYARFNYVAQPGDEGAGLHPRIGPYDEWSIIYGYKYLDAETPNDEEEILNSWIVERADDPVYRYGQQQGRVVDPSAQTEDIGSDAIDASDLGIENLKRIVPNLIEWTSEEGKDYDNLRELYSNVASQYRRYMGHVLNNVGGVYEYDKTADQDGAVYQFVDKEKQARAVDFLNRQLFATPDWMIDQEILNRIGGDGVVDVIRGLQRYTLNSLFTTERLNRMMEDEAVNSSDAYTAAQLFEDTREGIFSELYNKDAVDPFRRNLHRLYIDRMGELLMETDGEGDISDAKALARMGLEKIKTDSREAAKKASGTKKAHLKDLAARAEMILDGKLLALRTAGKNSGDSLSGVEAAMKGCWED